MDRLRTRRTRPNVPVPEGHANVPFLRHKTRLLQKPHISYQGQMCLGSPRVRSSSKSCKDGYSWFSSCLFTLALVSSKVFFWIPPDFELLPCAKRPLAADILALTRRLVTPKLSLLRRCASDAAPICKTRVCQAEISRVGAASGATGGGKMGFLTHSLTTLVHT